MHRVGGAGRNQTHVHDGARGPGVALVDRIAVRIDLERAIKVRALIDRAFAVVLHHAAPENRAAFVVVAFQFEPAIEGIDRAAGEEMADALGAHHNIDANCVAAADGGLHAVERRGDGAASALDWAGRDFRFRFFSHGEGGGEFVLRLLLRLLQWPALCRRERKNVHRKSSAGQEIFGAFNCAASSLAVGSAVLAAGKRWECTLPAMFPMSLEGSSGMWQSAHCCGFAG